LLVERALRQAGTLHQILQADPIEAMLSKKTARDVDYGFPIFLSLCAAHSHFDLLLDFI
jgi:hypothetical protein